MRFFKEDIKRGIDIVGSIGGLIFLSPLLVGIAICVVLDSAGAPLVRVRRVSQGRIFLMWKFRTMCRDAEQKKLDLLNQNHRSDSPFFKMADDPRVTRCGKFLRRTRLDELPQLLNVLRGEMSLVGPRPHEPEEVSRFNEKAKVLLKRKAGITGMAQVAGASQHKPFLPFDEEVRLEDEYARQWSLRLDFSIMIKTIGILFLDHSAW